MNSSHVVLCNMFEDTRLLCEVVCKLSEVDGMKIHGLTQKLAVGLCVFGGLLVAWYFYQTPHLPLYTPTPFPARPHLSRVHFMLQLLHASDHEGGMNAIEDAPRMSAVIRGLHKTHPNTVLVSSGDNYIVGPFYRASLDPTLTSVLGLPAPGRGDIALLNAMGFQVSAFGNHEFDEGTQAVASLLGQERKKNRVYEGTLFPYLSANLDFASDPFLSPLVVDDGLEAHTIPNKIARSAVISVGGEKIGFVGATTPELRRISNAGRIKIRPDHPEDLDTLATIIQRVVDKLIQRGINKIVLLSHMQEFVLELRLASKLRGVDIIVGGGSDSILAHKTSRLRRGDQAHGPYPSWRTSASGEPVAVVNTDGQYRYVGRLVVGFSQDGVLLPTTIDPKHSGPYPTDKQGVLDTGNEAPHPKVVQVVQGIRQVLLQKDGNFFGFTRVFLNGMRISVRREETNFGNLSSDANLFVARQFDPKTTISLKNGGAIRTYLGEVSSHIHGKGKKARHDKVKYLPPGGNPLTRKMAGQISQLDIENALRFNNSLVLLTVTASRLQKLMEHSVATWTPHHTPGQFPQIGGFAFSFDPRRPAGQRVRSLVVSFPHGRRDIVIRHGKLMGKPSRTFRMVTLRYLAKGGDGYPMPDLKLPFTAFVDLTQALQNQKSPITFTAPGKEQHALAEYLHRFHPQTQPYDQTDVPVHLDRRIQNLMYRKDTVLRP